VKPLLIYWSLNHRNNNNIFELFGLTSKDLKIQFGTAILNKRLFCFIPAVKWDSLGMLAPDAAAAQDNQLLDCWWCCSSRKLFALSSSLV